MTGTVEKNYSLALFDAINEEGEDLASARAELNSVRDVVNAADGFVKLMNTPTVSNEEKISVIKEAFEGKLSRCVYNFLCVVTEGRRWDRFEKIAAAFSALCNERLGIAEITVTTAFPLTSVQREQIQRKMSQMIGKKVLMSEKLDKAIMGGIVVDYGDTRMDGSVRTRLEGLRDSFSQLIG
ncbi:MAG: ATP synthase F1 subunit delta [Bacteroides sp.]|nr:ATP synthase F1 subunit delta [Bacteroides sp.]